LGWEPGLCKHCPVPDILHANACPNMVLEARVVKRWLGLVRRIKVSAHCVLSHSKVDDPYVGCGQCHPEAAEILGQSHVAE